MTRHLTIGARHVAVAFLHIALVAPAHALDDAGMRELEARCEAAREAALAPLRAGKIAECKADRRNDPGFCERFWRDYGNAVRTPDGRWLPRLFDDLPECVAVHEARRGRVRR